MNIDDFRCIIEWLIMPVVAWLGRVFARGRRAASEQDPMTENDAGLRPGETLAAVAPPVEVTPAAGAASWDGYSDRRAAPGTRRAQSVPRVETQRKPPSSLSDFGPGALAAFLVTLGILAYGYSLGTELAPDVQQMGLIAELACLPVSLVTGAVSGVVGGRLAKRVMRPLRVGEQLRRNAIFISSFISGVLTGFSCDGFALLAAFF